VVKAVVVHELIREEKLVIRLRDDRSDYGLMAKWLTGPRVLEFYEKRDNPLPFDRIKAKYAPSVLVRDDVVPCLLVFRGRTGRLPSVLPVTEEVNQRLAFGNLRADSML